MENLVFELAISELQNDYFVIEIFHQQWETKIKFSWSSRDLIFEDNGSLSRFLQENEYQLRKILHNKRPETFFVGFKLKFVLRPQKDVVAFNSLTNYIVLDKRNADLNIFPISESNLLLPELYTDGCYLEKYKCGGMAAIFKSESGKLNLITAGTAEQSSSLIELKAAILALENSAMHQSLRLFTDSRYVIKGLTEWLVNWKLNDWHTAQGKPVKNIDEWKYFDELCNGKYIEFKWVKAHSQHTENTLADFYAKETALRFFVEN